MKSQIAQQEFLLGHEGSGDAVMALPTQADLDVILESETVETIEEGDDQAEGIAQESTIGSPEGEQEPEPMETNPPQQPCVSLRG